MDFWFPNAGIDLNNPAQEDDGNQEMLSDRVEDLTRLDEDVTGNVDASGNNTGAGTGHTSADTGAGTGHTSADTGAGTGHTLSSPDSGGEEEVQSTPDLTPVQKPYPDMVFATLDDARMCYNRYAKSVGFSIKASTSRNSAVDKQKDKQLFVCNKNGKNEDINQQEAPPVRQRNRNITKKTDCKARLRVKRRAEKWHVTMFIEEHNHPCIKKFSLKKYLRSHRGIPKEERDFIKLLHKVNLSAGRVMAIMAELYGNLGNVPYESKTVSNYMATLDDGHTFGDMSLLLAEFEKIKKDDPDFFHRLDLDQFDRVKRIFWVDGPARAAYKHYSDCVSFDATYMTNAYKMPFAPFIGINRYGQSIQLGCGFLKNEEIEDYVWLYEQFLEAHGGVQPRNIITDQDGSMKAAILAKFPDAWHRNCRWHIMQNAQAVLGNFLSKREELRKELNDIIDHSMTVDEFETRWAEMILKHDVADNTHLADLYDLRTMFVPAYHKDRFFPFLQTTARSEGFNAVLKKYVKPHNSMFHFFKQYMKLQEKIEATEDSNEFQMEDKVLRVWGDYPLEKQALEVYTHPIYLRFRAELRKVTSYNVNHVEGQQFSVAPIGGSVFGYGKRSYKVEANLQEANYQCECSKFSRDGILCCHVLRVMVQLGAVDFIPPQYILPRWTKPEDEIVAVKVELPEMPSDRKLTNKERKMLRYGILCNDFTEHAKVAAESEKGKALADKYMRALGNELKAMKLSESAKRKEKKGKAQAKDASGVEAVDDDGQGSASQYQNVRDPECTTTKGRPTEKRKKSGLHLKSKKPSKIIPDPKPLEIDFLGDMV